MTRITLDVDEQVIRRAEQIASDRKTTVTQMVREFLESVAADDAAGREEARRRLAQSFGRLSRDMGPRRWRREDLYER
jgi:hypothetical protein